MPVRGNVLTGKNAWLKDSDPGRFRRGPPLADIDQVVGADENRAGGRRAPAPAQRHLGEVVGPEDHYFAAVSAHHHIGFIRPAVTENGPGKAEGPAGLVPGQDCNNLDPDFALPAGAGRPRITAGGTRRQDQGQRQERQRQGPHHDINDDI